MVADRQFAFGAFRFNTRTGQLWRDGSEVKLTPRAAAVLQMLVERAPEVVTKQELFDGVWGGMAVGDDSLTSCIHELRDAIGDDARYPRTIETRYRRGYRFIMPATRIVDQCRAAAPPQVPVCKPSQLVGRLTHLQELGRAFDRAWSGQRQIVFVTGEPGIGKSSLTDFFLEQLQTTHAVRIAHGQCVDHHGIGEPYLPLIEALTRLAGGPDGTAVKRTISAQAPSWFAQMPSLWTRSERSALEARGRATRDRMMRELTLAVETIASEAPILLKLEDIHWSDASTLDWLAHVARRPEPARLMVLATFRPNDAAAAKADLGGLVTELALHGQCKQIALGPLGLEAIEIYLMARLGDNDGSARSREMATLLLERTGGNPLFVVSIVNELAQPDISGRTTDAILSIPHDVRRFIDRQIDQLNESDRSLLTAASVIGREFTTAAVAAALEIDVEKVETRCAHLSRHGVFTDRSASVTWPDGTPAELYSFRHDLYRLDVIASQLAEHFERGNELAQAIPYHQRAAAKALRRSANKEAIGHLRRALDAIEHIEDEVERTRVEVELRVGLGAAFMANQGFGAPEVLEAYSRAEELCKRLGDRPDIFAALWGQWLFRWGRSEMDTAWRLCMKMLALAKKYDDSGLKLQAHHAAWATSFARGELAKVRAHAKAGLALYDAKNHQAMASSNGNHDAAICARYFSALSLALAGEEERARMMADTSLAAARRLDDPFSLALSLYFASVTAQVLDDVALAARHAEASRQMATEHDLAMPRAWSTGVMGWCAVETGDPAGGIALLTEAVTALEAAHSRHFMPYLLGLLSQAHMKVGHHADAMKAAEDGIALAAGGGERFYTAELHRLRGELLARRQDGHIQRAEASFQIAIELARDQGAIALENKAIASLRRWCDVATLG
jgi:DNA-binding winged helix-turn-helix (wHTH) protein/predicted ATPase